MSGHITALLNLYATGTMLYACVFFERIVYPNIVLNNCSSLVLAKMLYECPAWSGFYYAADDTTIDRLNKFVIKCKKQCLAVSTYMSELANQSAFASAHSNSPHVALSSCKILPTLQSPTPQP